MSVSYEYYRVFHCVAESGSITGAANQLFLAQSTVSRTIQNLEQALGCQLLRRSASGVALTQEGELLYFHLQKAIEHIRTAEERLAELRDLQAGTLRIGVSELTLEHYLLPLVEQLKQEYPNINVRLSYSTPGKAAKDLEAGTLDLAVLSSPLGNVPDISVKKLLPLEFALVGGRKYAGLHTTTFCLDSFSSVPFILMERGMSVRGYADTLSKGNITPAYEVGSLPALVAMAKANLGLAFVPRFYVERELQENSLIDICTNLPREDICLLLSQTVPQSSVTKYFCTLLEQNIIK